MIFLMNQPKFFNLSAITKRINEILHATNAETYPANFGLWLLTVRPNDFAPRWQVDFEVSIYGVCISTL